MLSRELMSCLPDPFTPAGPVLQVRRDTVRLIIVWILRRCGVLGVICPIGVSDDASDMLVEPCPATVRVDRGVGRDLGAIDRDGAKPAQPRPGSDHQHLGEQVGERRLRLSAESGHGGVVGTVLGTQHPERHIGDARSFDLPRRSHPLAVGVDQKPEQHPWVVARGARSTATPRLLQRRGVERFDRLEHEPHQVIRRKPLPHIHRQKHRLVPKHRTEELGHDPCSRNTHDADSGDTRFCDRLYGASKRTFSYLGYYAWWRMMLWLRRKHPRLTWKQARRRYYGADRISDDGLTLYNPAKTKVERYLFRGAQIGTPFNVDAVSTEVRFRHTGHDDVAFVGRVSEQLT